jgi:hypothetical protein
VTLMSDGGVLLTFTLDTDELLDIARSRLTRDFTVCPGTTPASTSTTTSSPSAPTTGRL